MSNVETEQNQNPKPRTHYSAEFKRDAVDQVIRTGLPASKISSELGIRGNLLSKWVRNHLKEMDQQSEVVEGLSPSEMAAEIKRLKAELDRTSEQRDILKKVLSILSSEPNGGAK